MRAAGSSRRSASRHTTPSRAEGDPFSALQDPPWSLLLPCPAVILCHPFNKKCFPVFAKPRLAFSVLGSICSQPVLVSVGLELSNSKLLASEGQPCEAQPQSPLQGSLPIPSAARGASASHGDPVCVAAWGWHCCPPTLSSSLGLMLGPAQHPRLQVVSGPSTTGGRSCLCQAARLDLALELFSWLWWLLVTQPSWPEEKQFERNACCGAGFAKAKSRAGLLCSLGSLQFVATSPSLWLLVAPSISRIQTPQ